MEFMPLPEEFEISIANSVTTLLALAAKQIVERGAAPQCFEIIELPEQVFFRQLNIPLAKRPVALRTLEVFGREKVCVINYTLSCQVRTTFLAHVSLSPLAIEINYDSLVYMADYLMQHNKLANLFVSDEEIRLLRDLICARWH